MILSNYRTKRVIYSTNFLEIPRFIGYLLASTLRLFIFPLSL